MYLKLEAEAIIVTSITITFDNEIELLLFANEKNYVLLKETVMDFITKNKDEVAREVSFENVPGSLMTNLLMADSMGDSMGINTLREKLHDKGLDIDGSMETMIALLGDHS